MLIHDIMNDMAQVAQSSGIGGDIVLLTAHEYPSACPADVLFIIDSTSSVKGVFELYKEYVTKVSIPTDP